MKKLLCFLLAAFMLFGATACGNGRASELDIPHHFAPVISVSKSGLATWKSMSGENVVEYEYRINNGKETKTRDNTVQLEINDKIYVRCIGDGITYRTSRWSSSEYIPAHSYVVDNAGIERDNFNIYTPDGTVVLDTIGQTKKYGDVIETNEDYIFEFDMTKGDYQNGLLLAGIENSVISDFVWSDTPFNQRENEYGDVVETVDETDKFYEVLYDTKYSLHGDYPWIHRAHWFWQSSRWDSLQTYGWGITNNPINSANGIYDFRNKTDWQVEPNMCASLYGCHFISAGKTTKDQLAAGYKYCRFKINFQKINTISAGNVSGGEVYSSLAGKENFNFFAISHNAYTYVFFNSDNVKEHPSRDYSMVTDGNGDRAGGVNIYDAATGETVLAGMTDPEAVGSVLSTNKKYILEFDVEGSAEGAVIFTGVANSLISNPTWSDKTYANRTGESAVADTIRRLDNDTAHHRLEKDEPRFHRIWKSGSGYTGNYGAQCVKNAAGEVDTANGSNYDVNPHNGNVMTCLEFALSQWYATTKTNKQANRKYFRMTVEYRELSIIDCGGVVTDKTHPAYGTLGGTYFNTFVYSPNGGRYLYLSNFNGV